MSALHIRVIIPAIAATLGGLAVTGCGSSATTTTAPSSTNRCSVTLNGGGTVPAQGGAGTIGVSAARECSWSASAEGAWLSIRSGAQGQGDGSVEYAAAANPDPVVRRGAVVLNGQRFDVTQSAGVCSFSLGQVSASFPVAGGAGQVDLRASSAMCPWSAESDADWIGVRTRQGAGSSLVAFDVAPLAGGTSRTGAIRVGGLQFGVSQSANGCTYTISPSTHTAGTAGGAGSVTVATGPGCAWTATSSVGWLTFSPSSGAGPGPVAFTISPSGGASRSTTATIAGQPLAVTQTSGSGCSFAVQPLSHTVPAAGGSVSVTVVTTDTCPWSVSSSLPWVSVTGPSSFGGTDTAVFAVAPAAGTARTGTVTVAGQLVTIAQSGGPCSFEVSPSSVSVPADGGGSSVAVTTAEGCGWTATSQSEWITITGGASGSGSGSVSFQAAALSSGTRAGTIEVAGHTVTVTQSAIGSCTANIAPQSGSMDAAGGTVTVNITGSGGCAWTAVSEVPWMTVTPASGSGNGSVEVQVQANSGAARTGTATIAGRTFTVNQAAASAPACTYQVQPTSVDRNWRAWEIPVSVSTTSGCAWSAESRVDWLTVSSGATGEGNGTVVLQMAENTGDDRSTTVMVAGQAVEVIQRRRN
jgi:trimeric autotransporter adhesin